ncbi:uncharacterized protein LOC122570367 isoform X2 [Bombus pyrosoma]|uniref:uncharacterized protein LOC122570367 isoform X2 n=1 Tax=Bombus pyrosoma TaxID=396416 RepID=UPI001CB98CF8|nr:uncharacterized protein LOC122570367 isoform X2 [Bombus pyrosoma]
MFIEGKYDIAFLRVSVYKNKFQGTESIGLRVVRNYKIARKVDHFASSKVKIAFITFENDVIKGRRGKSGKTQRKLVCKEDNFNQT